MNRYHTLFGIGTISLFAYAIVLQSPGAFAAVLAWLFGTSLGYSMHKIVMLDVLIENEAMREQVEVLTESVHWEFTKRHLAEEKLNRVMEMDNAVK